MEVNWNDTAGPASSSKRTNLTVRHKYKSFDSLTLILTLCFRVRLYILVRILTLIETCSLMVNFSVLSNISSCNKFQIDTICEWI